MTSIYRISAAALGLDGPRTGGYLSGGSCSIRPDGARCGAATTIAGRTHARRTRLKGSYGFTTTGSIVAAGPVGLVADVGVMTFDGVGNVSRPRP